MDPNTAFALEDGHIAIDGELEPGHADILSLNLESGITSQEERLPIIPSELHDIIDYIGLDKIVRMSKEELKEAKRIGRAKLDQDRLDFVKNHVIPAVAARSPNLTTLELVLTQTLANAIFYEMMNEDSTPASVREVIKQLSGVDLSQPMDLFREYEMDDLEAAFFQRFTDPDDYIEHLKNEIIRCSTSYGEDCLFPGVSIVQTSGSGKSRSIAELSKSFYVVYCSFMRKSWTGFPQRSNIADELLKGSSDFESYFKACYEVVNSYLRANNGSQRPSEDISHYFFKQQVTAGTRDLFYEDLERAMRSITNKKSGLSDHGSLKMLFVFDEAHQMRDYQTVPKSTNRTGTAFVRMRSAAAKLFSKKQTQAFIIMMDTTSRISTIGPSAEQDPSMRVVQGLKIFRPLFLIGSFDVGQKSAYGKPLDVALGAGRLFALGRPLWQSLMKDESSKRKVRTLAVLKLAGGTSKPKFDEKFAIAVVRTRVPFVVMRSYIASELVASHMWWCYGIDDTRQHVVAGLPSEPILAEAGACWMHHAVHLNQIFEKFSTSITAGFIDVGEGGETVAQLILILGRDCAAVHLRKDVSPVKGEPPAVTSTVMRRQVNAEVREVDQVEKGDDRDPGFLAADSVLFSGAIGVLSFLEATFTAAAVGELRRASKRLAFLTGLPDPVEVGQISFTHFVPMFDRVTNMRDLATLFSRGAAVKCPPGCPGVDLIIPVLMPGRTGDYSLLAENMTFILVQVKNYQLRGQDQSYPDSATRHNSPQRCGLDPFPQHLYISLYMGLDLHPASYKVWHPGSNLENDFTAPEGLEKYAKLLQRLGEDDGTECQALRKEAQEIWRTHKRNTHTKRTKRKLASEVEDGEPSDGAQDGISECPDTHWVVDLADAVRKRRQIAISLLGLRDSLYICLEGKEVVLQCLMSVLRGPTNPLKTASVNDRAILARMMYPMSMEKVREVEEYVDEEALPSEIDLL